MQINLRKAMFVLPNLFTVSSIFLGFYSMTLAAGDATPEQLYRAALAIFFAIFFDMFDGRVARMTRTQSDFGVQLDSLADVISFGAAPALLVYKWALAPMGFMGLFLSFAFAACGALRLARFNVLAARGDKASHRFFTGLPIPLAAGALVSVVIAHYRHYLGPTEPSTHVPIAVGVALLSFLMVSTVRYRTFKDTRLSREELRHLRLRGRRRGGHRHAHAGLVRPARLRRGLHPHGARRVDLLPAHHREVVAAGRGAARD